ncbi:MAG: tRNA (adenosine(37)-N6)-threonylcarbamoyltransferase complex dimerization subunit type 1 TsaB [Candidatus Zixiibacteriota bacterium]|nr:MAG: tRNA (adenosine(37)-N6)-threonylcarbamoyltransferase complex dimerization subunit type 1 TsaB [candidate division Zixibacteria bacterium]
MMVLGIETSDDFVGVGLADETGILTSRASAPELRNKNLLHEFTKDTLESAGKNFTDIEGVSVSMGPGSFTGLRVGLAAAKGICWSRNIPFAGIPSTEVIAESVRNFAGRFLAVKDARRNEFYYGAFECDGSRWARILPDKTGAVDDILMLVAEGFKVAGRRSQMEKSGILPADMIEYSPHNLGGIVALLGRKRLVDGENLDVASAAPEYLRYPSAGRSGR